MGGLWLFVTVSLSRIGEPFGRSNQSVNPRLFVTQRIERSASDDGIECPQSPSQSPSRIQWFIIPSNVEHDEENRCRGSDEHREDGDDHKLHIWGIHSSDATNN
jgi:hypothetical protein